MLLGETSPWEMAACGVPQRTSPMYPLQPPTSCITSAVGTKPCVSDRLPQQGEGHLDRRADEQAQVWPGEGGRAWNWCALSQEYPKDSKPENSEKIQGTEGRGRDFSQVKKCECQSDWNSYNLIPILRIRPTSSAAVTISRLRAKPRCPATGTNDGSLVRLLPVGPLPQRGNLGAIRDSSLRTTARGSANPTARALKYPPSGSSLPCVGPAAH